MTLFDGCILNFGGVVKYLVTYEGNGSILNLKLLEVIQNLKERPDEVLTIGFTDKPIVIGRSEASFLRINS